MTKQEIMVLSQTSLLGNVSKAMRYVCVTYQPECKALIISCWLDSHPTGKDKELMYSFCGELNGHFIERLQTEVEFFHDIRPYAEIIQDVNKRQLCIFAMSDNT